MGVTTLDIENLYERATKKGLKTPGLMTMFHKAKGSCVEPVTINEHQFVIPKQVPTLDFRDGMSLAFFSANLHEDGEMVKGQLVVCIESHVGFFVPEEDDL